MKSSKKVDVDQKFYKKIVLKNNIIVGLTLVNCIDRAGTLYYLIKNKIDVKKFKAQLLADDFNLATLPQNIIKKMKAVQ